MGDKTPETYAKQLAANRKPHPTREARKFRLLCLGPCRQPFWSTDPKHNRRCQNCQRLDYGMLSGSASLGSNWHRGKGGA